MRKASLFVDGNALFHAIDDFNDPALKWLDLPKLAAQVGGSEASVKRIVFAFTVTGEDRAKAQQERVYLRALAAMGVDTLVDDPVREYHECARCGHGWDERRARGNETALALEILEGACSNAYDEAMLVTDQISESHLTRKLSGFPHMSLTLLSLRTVPRMMHDTERLRRRTLTKKLLRSAMLGETVSTTRGESFARPRGWTPRESATWRDLEITGL
jgi:hypothetical protein